MLHRVTKSVVCLSVLVAAASTSPVLGQQVVGTFQWQMQPYCNLVTLSLTATPAGYALGGSDNQCGANERASAFGMAAFSVNGTVSLNFTVVAAPSGLPLHVSAVVNPANGGGTWTDSVGNSGTFAFFANAPGLPSRPMPISAIAADSITTYEIAPGAVGGSDINTSEVQARVSGACVAGTALVGVGSKGSVSCAPVQSPVTGTCSVGQAVVAVNVDGSVSCAATDPAAVRFRVRDANSLTLASLAIGTVAWGNLEYNVGGGTYDAVGGTFTIPANGTYLITAAVRFETSSAVNGFKCLVAGVGGGPNSQWACSAQSTAQYDVPSTSIVIALNAGQMISVSAYNASSGTQQVSGEAQTSEFSVTRLQ